MLTFVFWYDRDPVAKAEGDPTGKPSKPSNPEPTVPGIESDLADTAGKQSRRST